MVQNYVAQSLTIFLVLALGLVACVARPDQKAVDRPVPSSTKRSIPASVPIKLDMELAASPGSSTGTLHISFSFWNDVTGAHVVYYQPREMSLLVYSEASDRRAGDSLIVWQGDSAANQVREFSFPVPVIPDQILQTSVYVSIDKSGVYLKDPWVLKAIYYLDTGDEILKVNSAFRIRQMQLKHKIQEKGYAGLDKYEIKERDRDLFWDLEYPFEKPEPETTIVIGPGGAPLQHIRLYRYHFDTLSHDYRQDYLDLNRTIARFREMRRTRGKLELPQGRHYSDLPDSIAVFRDNPFWGNEKRGAVYDAYLLRIQEWIRDHWSPGQNEE